VPSQFYAAQARVADGRGGLGAALLLFPGALGDAVCLEPAVAALDALGPVTLYARGGAAEIAALFPRPPAVIRSLDAREIGALFAPLPDSGIGGIAGIAGTSEQGGGDGSPPPVPAWLDGFGRIVSFTGASSPELCARLRATARATVAEFPTPDSDVHAADYFLGVVCGDRSRRACPPRVVVPEEDRLAAAALLQCRARPLLVVHPGSGGAAKRAPVALFRALGERWRSASGGSVTFLLGPAERNEAAGWASLGPVLVPADVRHLAALVASADAYLGNDAGPTHIAAASGMPGVALLTLQSGVAFRPRGKKLTCVELSPRRDGPADEDVVASWDALRAALP
ncbi:MAG TPA: glycosyltransferase family 9 protein, partial [Candidatus Bathyarchaeia archaeon]|nr:glycosyltransferase family 9 protein [Candidatus Bathyarchaeia archaeon]